MSAVQFIGLLRIITLNTGFQLAHNEVRWCTSLVTPVTADDLHPTSFQAPRLQFNAESISAVGGRATLFLARF